MDDLGAFARAQHQAIVDGEKTLAPVYWKLGLALMLAKQNFHHGQWAKFLAQWGISKARAARGVAIHRTFKDLRDVVGLSVEEAYDRRERRQGRRRGKAQADHARNPLRAFLRDARAISRRAEALVDEAAFARKDEASRLLPIFCELIQRLEHLRVRLQQADQL